MDLKRIIYLYLLLSMPLFSQNHEYTKEHLGFDPGEIKVIASPEPGSIRPMIISTFRGIPRLGLQNDFSFKYPPRNESSKVRSARRELMQKIREDSNIWRLLTTINLYQSTIDFEQWKQMYDPTDNVTDHYTTTNYKNPALYWLSLFKSLAAATNTPQAYTKYFCKTGSPCPNAQVTATNNPKFYKKKTERWGGIGASEFERRRKVIAFTEELAPTYLKWAQNFQLKEAYMVGKARVDEYNFKASGFPINGITPMTHGFNIIITYDPKAHSLLAYDHGPSPTQLNAILLKMPMEKAEKFIEDLKKKSPSGRGKEIFYVYKVNIKIKEKKTTASSYGFRRPEFQYEQIPANQKIEFFSDIYLKDKIYELTR